MHEEIVSQHHKKETLKERIKRKLYGEKRFQTEAPPVYDIPELPQIPNPFDTEGSLTSSQESELLDIIQRWRIFGFAAFSSTLESSVDLQLMRKFLSEDTDKIISDQNNWTFETGFSAEMKEQLDLISYLFIDLFEEYDQEVLAPMKGLIDIRCNEPFFDGKDQYGKTYKEYQEIFEFLLKRAHDSIDILNLLANKQKLEGYLKHADLNKKDVQMFLHEMRTPMTAIKGFVTTLFADDVKWEQVAVVEFINIIKEDIKRLLTSSEMFWNWMMSERTVNHYSVFSLTRDIDQAVGSYSAFQVAVNADLADKDLLSLTVQNNTSIDSRSNELFAWFSASLLELFIKNILSNAYKSAFSVGRTELYFSFRNEFVTGYDGKPAVNIVFSDNGSGFGNLNPGERFLFDGNKFGYVNKKVSTQGFGMPTLVSLLDKAFEELGKTAQVYGQNVYDNDGNVTGGEVVISLPMVLDSDLFMMSEKMRSLDNPENTDES